MVKRKIAVVLVALALFFGMGQGFIQHGYQAGEIGWCEDC